MRDGNQMMKQTKNIIAIAFVLVAVLITASGSALAGWTSMTSGTTTDLYSDWGSSGSDVFAVGLNGTILHYNGSAWISMTSGTTEDLTDVWGSSGSDVFAMGFNGTILHYNGSAWTSMTSGTTEDLYGVWGSSGSDVFAVGSAFTILHYNGTAWTSMTSGTTGHLRGVWGSSGSDVFAVGLGGIILHYNGSAWTAMTSGTTDALTGVWGSSGSDVFAAGLNGTIQHYDGVPGTTTSTTAPSSTTTTPSGNTAPSASFTASPSSGDTSTLFSVDASGCSDAEDSTSALLVIWDWETDGIWDTPPDAGKTADHQYAATGNYTITLKVEDTGGLSDTVTQEVKVITGGGSNTPPTASFTVSPTEGDTSTAFAVDASGSTDDGTFLEFHWDWESDGMWDTNFTTDKTASHTYSTGGLKTITLEVIDSGGLVDTTTLDVTVGGTSTTTVAPSAYTIDGMVMGAVSDNVLVELLNGSHQQTYTDDNGHYEFTGIAVGGHYLIIPQRKGYVFDPPQHEIPNLMNDEFDLNFISTKAPLCATSVIYGEYSEETELLRCVRDNVLNKTPEGREIIKLYYQWSPVIVKAMEKDENFKEEVKEMIDGVLGLVGGEGE